jgi:uncharacterized protein YdhG (YjbR/CyaY superfamily)
MIMKNQKKTIDTVEDYLATLSPAQQEHIRKLRQLILATSPSLEEGLNYSTPAYRLNGKLIVGIAAAKTHTGFYVMSEPVMKQFKNELQNFDTAKTSIRFLLDEKLPASLIKKIVLARIEDGNSKPKRA